MAQAKINIPDFEAISRELSADLVTYASVTGLNFFKESFEKQGFTDVSFEAWPARKDGDASRAILVNTANLRESTQISERGPERIIFSNTAPYAGIHNEGGIINVRVTAKARRFFWYMYKATKKEMWKAMALTKKERLAVKIPKRQFIGESKTLLNTLDKWIIGEILTRFKNA